MIERPPGVMRYIQQTEGCAYPSGAAPVEDHIAERYAALADWAESADTVMMSAVRDADPEPAWLAADPEPAWSAAESRPLPGPHVEPRRSGRARAGVIAGVAIAALAGGAAVLWGGDQEPSATVAVGPSAVAPATASSSSRPSSRPAPATTRSPSPSPSSSPSLSRSASPSVSPDPIVEPELDPEDAVPTRRTDSRETDPIVVAAFFGYQADPEAGYSGTIQVINAGLSATRDWVVRIEVPGAEKVSLSSGNVRVSQSGTVVTFQPSGNLAVGAALTIGFTIDGVPDELPGGCTVNGTACS